MVEMTVLFIASYAVTGIIQRYIGKMIVISGRTSKNYKGLDVPGFMGISIVVCCIVIGSISFVFELEGSGEGLFILLVGAFISLIGLIDDYLGNNVSKGFRGHMLHLLKGDLTTGGLKALMGGLVSFVIAKYVSKNWIDLVINTLIIGLSGNIINLFDVRPGRAIKAFLLISLYVLFASQKIHSYFIILLGSLIAYFPSDLKGKAMLGDTGSNFIGLILGTSIVLAGAGLMVKATILAILLSLNIASEMISFSKIIEKNKILRFIDNLWRD